MPVISIIVPVYNVEKFLPCCIESILNQSFSDFELILVDDGSQDNCGKICDNYSNKDNRIRVIHKENGGASSARNVGLDIAKGEFISFVDADDITKRNMLEKVIEYQRLGDYDIVEFSIKYIYDNAEIDKCENTNEIIHNTYSGREMIKRIFQNNLGGTIYPVNKLYKKSVFDNLRFEEGRICEDTLIMPKIYDHANEVFVTNEILYYYYQSDNSVMRKEFSMKKLDVIYAFESNRMFFLEKNYKEENDWLDSTYAFVLYNMAKKIKEKYGKSNAEYISIKKRFRSRLLSYIKNPVMNWKLKCILVLHFITI